VTQYPTFLKYKEESSAKKFMVNEGGDKLTETDAGKKFRVSIIIKLTKGTGSDKKVIKTLDTYYIDFESDRGCLDDEIEIKTDFVTDRLTYYIDKAKTKDADTTKTALILFKSTGETELKCPVTYSYSVADNK